MRDVKSFPPTQSLQHHVDFNGVNTSAHAQSDSTDSYFLSESSPFVDLNDEDVQEDFYAYGVQNLFKHTHC